MGVKEKIDALAEYQRAAHESQLDYNDRKIRKELLEEEAKLAVLGYVRFPRAEFMGHTMDAIKRVAKEARLDFVDLGFDGSQRHWIKPADIDALKTLLAVVGPMETALEERARKLKALYNAGVLTRETYERKMKELGEQA